jgi:hypothetical protein
MYVISCEIQISKILGVGSGLMLGLCFASVDIRCRLLLRLIMSLIYIMTKYVISC